LENASPPPLRLLSFTTLYPDSVRPRHGIFVETRLRHLVDSGAAKTVVVAPVPWFPFTSDAFGGYGALARVSRFDVRGGIDVYRPRYALLPKFGMSAAPLALALSALPVMKRIIAAGYDFDLIDAHYFYPDGVAAALLGRWLHKPTVITARGTDINFIPQYYLPRKMIQWAAARADAIICVCEALKRELVQLGGDADKITVLRNGVDLKLFEPIDRVAWRARLQLEHPTLVSVGHLIERKGHDIAIRALVELNDVRLMIVGDGEEETSLRRLAASLKVADRVSFVGPVAQQDLKNYYGAADALVLASSREGWPNVLLEAMACGTPVIATPTWGTPEVVRSSAAGVLMDERSPAALVRAFRRLFANYPDRAATRRYATGFGWTETTDGQLALFNRILRRN
jgi:teichuronic acid biosynthesis glycosyltransferase TuaC